MAVVVGGLHGRPHGNVAGIVYGAARSRQGKIVTARELVTPSNPNTPDQQTQRSKFSDSLEIVRAWGPSVYQDDWNRAIGQLPGFQSMMSVLLDNIDASLDVSPPPDTPLGDLHIPDTITFVTGGTPGAWNVTWSTENGSNGTAADVVKVIACQEDPDATNARRTGTILNKVRTDGDSGAGFTAEASHVVIFGLWVAGEGTAEGLLSLCSWGSGTSGAP